MGFDIINVKTWFCNRKDYKTQSKLLLKELKDMKKKGIGETEKGLNNFRTYKGGRFIFTHSSGKDEDSLISA